MERSEPNLALVTGANGSVGAAYLEKLSQLPNFRSVGFTRGPVEDRLNGVEYVEGVDLLDQARVEEAIESIRVQDFLRILLVHPVGKFKFEEIPPLEPDPEVLLSNGGTLQYAMNALFQRRQTDASFVLCGFGSVSDRYQVPFWTSYTAGKDRVRETLRGVAELANPHGIPVLSLMVNVSTTDTGNENTLRPHADRRYWLKPSTIVDRTLPILLGEIQCPFYREMDIVESKPGFNPDVYYRDHQAILREWKKAMNGN